MTDQDQAPERAPADEMPAGCLRAFLYAVGVPFAMIVAFGLGSSRVGDNCSECDMAGFEGVAWATVTFLVLVVAIAVGEVRLAGRRRPPADDPGQTGPPG